MHKHTKKPHYEIFILLYSWVLGLNLSQPNAYRGTLTYENKNGGEKGWSCGMSVSLVSLDGRVLGFRWRTCGHACYFWFCSS
uniref:Secreted protein n=1 Tax=Lactuca sativa TaxID=4236 RepID=A0A9R1XDX5_LACSA|nr:hypothetical protein LSAT_V11C500235620 [Lactuca sativa]